MNVEPAIGFLAPSGKFTRCNTYEHMRMALILCEKHGKKFYDAYDAEQWLLSYGYVIFRSNDAYMNHYKDISAMLEGNDYRVNLLTEEQLSWIKARDMYACWNNSTQAEYVYEILSKDKQLRR